MNTENIKNEEYIAKILPTVVNRIFALEGWCKKDTAFDAVTESKPSAAVSIRKRRRPEAQPKKNQPPKATGFSEPCAGCADVVTRWRFELQTHCLKGSCSTY